VKFFEQEIAEHVGAEHANEFTASAQMRNRDRGIRGCAARMLQEHRRGIRGTIRAREKIDQRFAETDDGFHLLNFPDRLTRTAFGATNLGYT